MYIDFIEHNSYVIFMYVLANEFFICFSYDFYVNNSCMTLRGVCVFLFLFFSLIYVQLQLLYI